MDVDCGKTKNSMTSHHVSFHIIVYQFTALRLARHSIGRTVFQLHTKLSIEESHPA